MLDNCTFSKWTCKEHYYNPDKDGYYILGFEKDGAVLGPEEYDAYDFFDEIQTDDKELRPGHECCFVIHNRIGKGKRKVDLDIPNRVFVDIDFHADNRDELIEQFCDRLHINNLQQFVDLLKENDSYCLSAGLSKSGKGIRAFYLVDSEYNRNKELYGVEYSEDLDDKYQDFITALHLSNYNLVKKHICDRFNVDPLFFDDSAGRVSQVTFYYRKTGSFVNYDALALYNDFEYIEPVIPLSVGLSHTYKHIDFLELEKEYHTEFQDMFHSYNSRILYSLNRILYEDAKEDSDKIIEIFYQFYQKYYRTGGGFTQKLSSYKTFYDTIAKIKPPIDGKHIPLISTMKKCGIYIDDVDIAIPFAIKQVDKPKTKIINVVNSITGGGKSWEYLKNCIASLYTGQKSLFSCGNNKEDITKCMRYLYDNDFCRDGKTIFNQLYDEGYPIKQFPQSEKDLRALGIYRLDMEGKQFIPQDMSKVNMLITTTARLYNRGMEDEMFEHIKDFKAANKTIKVVIDESASIIQADHEIYRNVRYKEDPSGTNCSPTYHCPKYSFLANKTAKFDCPAMGGNPNSFCICTKNTLKTKTDNFHNSIIYPRPDITLNELKRIEQETSIVPEDLFGENNYNKDIFNFDERLFTNFKEIDYKDGKITCRLYLLPDIKKEDLNTTYDKMVYEGIATNCCQGFIHHLTVNDQGKTIFPRGACEVETIYFPKMYMLKHILDNACEIDFLSATLNDDDKEKMIACLSDYEFNFEEMDAVDVKVYNLSVLFIDKPLAKTYKYLKSFSNMKGIFFLNDNDVKNYFKDPDFQEVDDYFIFGQSINGDKLQSRTVYNEDIKAFVSTSKVANFNDTIPKNIFTGHHGILSVGSNISHCDFAALSNKAYNPLFSFHWDINDDEETLKHKVVNRFNSIITQNIGRILRGDQLNKYVFIVGFTEEEKKEFEKYFRMKNSYHTLNFFTIPEKFRKYETINYQILLIQDGNYIQVVEKSEDRHRDVNSYRKERRSEGHKDGGNFNKKTTGIFPSKISPEDDY